MNNPQFFLTTETPQEHLIGVRNALLTLGLDSDKLFYMIKKDIEDGHLDKARQHLQFVDILVK